MKVRRKEALAGIDFSLISGDVVEVPDAVGEAWIEIGHAERVEEAPAPPADEPPAPLAAVETATVTPPETATVPPAKKGLRTKTA